jgi:hypothetical protein
MITNSFISKREKILSSDIGSDFLQSGHVNYLKVLIFPYKIWVSQNPFKHGLQKVCLQEKGYSFALSASQTIQSFLIYWPIDKTYLCLLTLHFTQGAYYSLGSKQL